MSRLLLLADISQALHDLLHSLDHAGLPLTAALIDLAAHQVEDEMSKMDETPTELARFDDVRFAVLDKWALHLFN